MEPTAGMMVTDNLRLAKRLGGGGMGSVWVAEHLGLDTTVAVKFIATELARSHPSIVTRFKREAGVAAKLKSPHVVQVFDHGLTPDGTPYIAMELLEGESLEDRLERAGEMTIREVALIVAQTTQVLSKAHAMGIVHRDIKPANLFLIESAYDLFVKVLDFGIAKNVDAMKEVSVTKTGAMMGSPLYMSPEQFTSAKGADSRADLWSLAVVAYHALTGRPSFGGDTLGQVMMAVMNREYLRPQALRPDLPSPFDAWFDKAYAKNIDDRFQTADELASSFLAITRAVGDSDSLSELAKMHGHERPVGGGFPDGPPPAPYVAFPAPAIVPTVGDAPSALAAGTLEPAAATVDPALWAAPGQAQDPVLAGRVTSKRWGAIGALGALLLAAGIGTAAYVTTRATTESAQSAAESAADVAASAPAGAEPEAPAAAETPSVEPSSEPEPKTASSDETGAPGDRGAATAGSAKPATRSAAGPAVTAGPEPSSATTAPKPKPNPKATPGGDEKDYGF